MRILKTIPIIVAALALTVFPSMAAEKKEVRVLYHNKTTQTVETGATFKATLSGATVASITTTSTSPTSLGTLEEGTIISCDKLPDVTYRLFKGTSDWQLIPSDGSETIHQDRYYPAGTPTFHLPYMTEEISATVYFEKNLPAKFKDKNVEIKIYNMASSDATVTGTGTDGMGLLSSFAFGKLSASQAQNTPIDIGNDSTVTWSNNGERVVWKHTREYSDMVVHVVRGDAYDSVYHVYHPTHTKNTEACVFYAYPEYYVKIKFQGDSGKESERPASVDTTQFIQAWIENLGTNANSEYDYKEKKLAADSGGSGALVLTKANNWTSELIEFDRSRTFLKSLTPSEVDYNWAAYDKVLSAIAESTGNYNAPITITRADYGNMIEIPLTMQSTLTPYDLITIWEGDEGYENLRPSYYYVDVEKTEGTQKWVVVDKDTKNEGAGYYRNLGTTTGNKVTVTIPRKIPWYETRIEYEDHRVIVIHKYKPITYHVIVEWENDSGHESERPNVVVNTTNYMDTESEEKNIKLTKDNDYHHSWVTTEAVEEGWNVNVNDLDSKNYSVQRIIKPDVNGDYTFHIVIRYIKTDEYDIKTTTEDTTTLKDKDGKEYTLKNPTTTSTVNGRTYISDSAGKILEIDPKTKEVLAEVTNLPLVSEEASIEVAQVVENLGNRLPQTGQDWMKVIFFLVVGVVLISLGLHMRKRNG